MRFDRRRSSSYRGLHLNDKILVGVEIATQYLGCGIVSQVKGTDYEIARLIYDIHSLYSEEKNKLKNAKEVVVFIDSQRIDISSKDDDHLLVNFPLTQVKDITVCLNDGPYSRTCVLVARENHISQYKAYVFYCKTYKLAHEFYELATLAFQLGFTLLEKFNEKSVIDEPFERLSPRYESVKTMTSKWKIKGQTRSSSNDISQENDNVFIDEDEQCTSCVLESEDCLNERAVTVLLAEDNLCKSHTASFENICERKTSCIETDFKKSDRNSHSYLGNLFRKSCRRIRSYFRQESLVPRKIRGST